MAGVKLPAEKQFCSDKMSHVSWFNPSQQLSTTQPLTHSQRWDGGENQKSKSEKTRGLR